MVSYYLRIKSENENNIKSLKINNHKIDTNFEFFLYISIECKYIQRKSIGIKTTNFINKIRSSS